MKILYLSSDLIVHDTLFLNYLVRSGHSVVLLTYYHKRTLPDDITSISNLKVIHHWLPSRNEWRDCFSFRFFRVLIWFLFWRGIILFLLLFYKILPNRILNHMFLNKPLIYYLSFRVMQLRHHFDEVVEKEKPDLIHSGWLLTDSFLAVLSGFKPLLVMPWGSDVLVFPKESKIYYYIAKYTIEHSQYVTCDCEEVKNKLQHFCDISDCQFFLFPWGVDLKRFKPKPVSYIRDRLGWQSNKVLIMTRSFEPVYGVEYFIKALPKVIEEMADVRVLFLGDGTGYLECKTLVSKLGLEEYVHFEGWVEHEMLPDYLNSADIYVSTSISDGTSLSLLEAMACDLPVVVTDVPANLEWINHEYNGFVVPRRSVLELSNTILLAMKQPELMLSMGDRNLSLVKQKANWEQNFAFLLNIYDKIVLENQA